MDDVALREAAPHIDQKLRRCRYQTLVHGDANGVREAAHSLRGMSLNVAANDLGELAHEVEKAAKESDLEAAAKPMPEIEHQFVLVKAFVWDLVG